MSRFVSVIFIFLSGQNDKARLEVTLSFHASRALSIGQTFVRLRVLLFDVIKYSTLEFVLQHQITTCTFEQVHGSILRLRREAVA
jgi:hypothetical protein